MKKNNNKEIKKNNIVLKANYNDSIIFCLVIVIFFVSAILLSSFGDQNFKAGIVIGRIMMYGFSPLLILYFIFVAVREIQLAIINEKGILIRDLFQKIVFINWYEIFDVEVEILYSAACYISQQKLIVVYLKKKDMDMELGAQRNKKKQRPPWFINANKKNVEVIIEYLNKYRPDIDTQGFMEIVNKKIKR